MLRRKCRNRDICVFIDHPWLDFVSLHFPAIGEAALVSVGIRTCLDVDAIRLQNVLGHRLQTSGAVNFERVRPA